MIALLRIRFCLLAVTIAIGGCTTPPDPAQEAPVELKPGMYKISYGAGGLAGLATPEKSDRGNAPSCIGDGDIADLPKLIITNAYPIEHCDADEGPRVGNLVSGKLVCQVDPERARGTYTVNWTGTIAPDSLRIESKMTIDAVSKDPKEAAQFEQGKLLMSVASMVTTAERLGDCP